LWISCFVFILSLGCGGFFRVVVFEKSTPLNKQKINKTKKNELL